MSQRPPPGPSTPLAPAAATATATATTTATTAAAAAGTEPAPLLVLGWGNLSRADDTLGPLFINLLRQAGLSEAEVTLLDDYQLQVAHALLVLVQLAPPAPGQPPLPECTLLAIRGERFELGQAPGAAALALLDAALVWVQRWWAVGA